MITNYIPPILFPRIEAASSDNEWRVQCFDSGELRILHKDRVVEIMPSDAHHAKLIEALVYRIVYQQKHILTQAEELGDLHRRTE